MTPTEFAIEIRRKIEALRRNNRPLNVAAASTHTKMSKRIFVEGKARNESSIGSYSTKDIYLKELKDPIGGFGKKKKPYGIAARNRKGLYPKKGIDGNEKFKTTDRARITSYFKGWKDFRSVQGLQTAVVDLNYTGDMFKDFAKSNLPFLDQVVQLNLNEYASTFTREINTKKAKGNEEHFRKSIFELSNSEKDNFYRILELELKQALEIR
jgi:hypothetical protein